MSQTTLDRSGPSARRPGQPALVAPRRRRRSPVRTALLALSALLLLAAVVVAGWTFRRYRQFDFVEIPGVESAPATEPANWLLVGTDSREGVDPGSDDFLGDAAAIPGQRADTIMVARVDPDTKAVDLLSIPRDLWVPIVGDSEGRINGAFNAAGGRERLVLTIENYLGVHLNHYVEIDFAGFQKMVEALGGVPMWFDQPMRDPGSGLNIVDGGCHLLDGPQALSFARSRKAESFVDGQWRAEPGGDLGRTARQRQFLSQVAATASAKASLGGVLTFDRLLAAAADNLVIDNGAGMGDVADLARTFAAAEGGNFNSHALPVSDWTTPGGAQVLLLQEEAAQPTLDLFRNPGEERPANTGLSGDLSVVEATVGAVQGATAEQLESIALPGVSQPDCSQISG